MINLSEFKKIHCIGIGGIGLSAIAEILMSRGYQMTGSDMKASEITDKLTADGATIYFGHRAENVEDAELIIYSAAVGKDNPELIRAAELGIPVITRAQALGALMRDHFYGARVTINATGSMPYMLFKPSSVKQDKTVTEIIGLLRILDENRTPEDKPEADKV